MPKSKLTVENHCLKVWGGESGGKSLLALSTLRREEEAAFLGNEKRADKLKRKLA